MRLEKKIAIITGAANGIGRATALKFASEGAEGLVLSDLDSDHGEQLAAQINEEGDTRAVFVTADASEANAAQELVETALAEFGRLDVAFNNAGIEGEMHPVADYPIELFDRVIGINLRGVFLGMKFQIPAMKKNGGGVILNMSSVAGLKGFGTLGPYSASKHAVIGLSKSAALEVAEAGIRINVVCPGAIDTPMIHRITGGDEAAEEQFQQLQALGRFGTPEEIADFAAWICSEEASFLTGVAVPVDGGIMAG